MNVVWCLRSTGQGFFDEISNFEITQQITAGSKLQVSESTIRMLKIAYTTRRVLPNEHRSTKILRTV